MKLKQLMDFEMDKNKKSSLQVKAVKALAGFLILMFLLTILSRAADSLTIAKVTASAATGGVISHNIEVDGNITPNKDIAISTSANIKIASVEATEGKTVKKGDLLIQLDTADLKKKLLQAQKELQVAKATASDKKANEAIAADTKSKSLQRTYEDYNQTVADANDSVSKAKSDMNEAWNAYNTYKNLVTPTKENYNVTLEYNENVSSTYPKTLSSTNTFNGWYTDNDVRVTNNTSLATEEAHTLNAKYTTSSVALPTPEKEGYYFEGWYKDSSFSNKITNKIYIPSKDETLYAKFIELPEVEINLKLEEENKINLEVEKQKGNLSGYEIYLYNNETNTYEKIRDENDLETTIDYEFKDFENVKIYVRPFITIENKRVYGNISSIKEIGPEIKVGTLEITKIDKETKEKLEGTEIEIYDEQTNERVFKGTTNKNGILKVNDLIVGKNYYLKESVPSKGYKLNNEEIKIKLEKENEEKKIQIENEIIKGNIKITVVEEYTKEPIENVSVLINDESKSTNVLGEIILDDVRYGNYVISLEEVPDGYLLKDTEENIMIEEETTEEITITLEKEKIPVPITDSDKNNLLEKIIGLVLIIIGIVSIVFYVRKKNA